MAASIYRHKYVGINIWIEIRYICRYKYVAITNNLCDVLSQIITIITSKNSYQQSEQMQSNDKYNDIGSLAWNRHPQLLHQFM